MGRRVKPSESQLRSVWRQVEELSDREQLELFKLLGDRLALGPGRPTEFDPQIADRARALEDMALAAEHLGLPQGKAPTYEQYGEAHKALGLSMSPQQVLRRWEFWRTATEAFAGRRSVRTASQRSHARATGGRERTHLEYIAGVRLWLDSNPPSVTADDYDEWVEGHNEQLPKGEQPPVFAQAIRMALAVPWDDVVAVAYEEADLAEVQAAAGAVRARKAGSRGLVGIVDIAQMLDMTRSSVNYNAKREGFPTRVARISRRPAWVRADIEAWANGEAVPQRELDEAQTELIDSAEMSKLVGLTSDPLRTRIHEQRWDRVPQPSGQVSDAHYWEREEYEAWERERGEN